MKTSPPISARYELCREVWKYADRRFFGTAGAVAVLGLVEAGGLLLVWPLLQAIGVGAGEEAGRLGEVLDWLRERGLPVTLGGLLAVYLGLAVVQTGAKTALADLNARINTEFTHYLRARLQAALVGARWPVFLEQRGADTVRVIAGEAGMAGGAATGLIALGAGVVMMVIQAGIAWLISPVVTVASLAAGGVVVFLIRPLILKVRRDNAEEEVDRGAMAANLTDHVAVLKLAKAHGVQGGARREFEKISRAMGRRRVAVARNQALASAGFGLGAAVALCGFLWFAVTVQGVAGAELGVLAAVFMRLASRLMGLQTQWQRLELMRPAFVATERLRREWEQAAETVQEGAARRRLERELHLRGVGYRYPGAEKDALTGVDLVLPAGRTTAVCGVSGSGKSTLADLCLGLLEPTTGVVTVDGERLEGEVLAGWRSSVAYVPQDCYLSNATVRKNLLLLAPEADETQLWTALRAAAAEELVRALPQGLDTVLGDRGVKLSGGERQRLALARALLREPTLLVLDEATSALDALNERLVQEAIKGLHGRMTIVVIAHRLSTLRSADQVAVLDAGRVVQNGEWSALKAEDGGVFARLAEAAEI